MAYKTTHQVAIKMPQTAGDTKIVLEELHIWGFRELIVNAASKEMLKEILWCIRVNINKALEELDES